ncbi:MAG: hypothetical protein NTV81_02770 [Candidatus Komeilibacteria bacterium]|nr:hypothetical protein [Candidatus Komeilibacteria bacterium]
MSLLSVVSDIKKLKIQGAAQVSQAAVEALIVESRRYQRRPLAVWQKSIAQAAWRLEQSRPTEPMMVNSLHYLVAAASRLWPEAAEGQEELTKMQASLIKQYQVIDQKIVHFGLQLISSGSTILTHCHSGTVEKILLKAHQQKKFSVVNTETRPLFQGHITAMHLTQAGVPVTMIVDSAAPSFLANLNDFQNNQIKIDQVIIGADALLYDGSAINKIGSYGIALAAWANHIPVYVAASLLKLDADNQIVIERRSTKEIWQHPSVNLDLINPAFDVIPAKYLTGLICERGVIAPREVKKSTAKEYPWLLKN